MVPTLSRPMFLGLGSRQLGGCPWGDNEARAATRRSDRRIQKQVTLVSLKYTACIAKHDKTTSGVLSTQLRPRQVLGRVWVR